jgi:hypothetical protein
MKVIVRRNGLWLLPAHAKYMGQKRNSLVNASLAFYFDITELLFCMVSVDVWVIT